MITLTKYCKELNFDSDLDYKYIHELIKELFVNEQIDCDFCFDWAEKEITTGTKPPILITEEDEQIEYDNKYIRIVHKSSHKKSKGPEELKNMIQEKALGVEFPSFYHSVSSPKGKHKNTTEIGRAHV